MTCFLKDHTWGECLPDCKKGKHPEDPKEYRTAWSCAQVAKKGKKVVVKEYGQCGGMLAGQGEKKYDGPTKCEEGCHCAKQSMWISICRPNVAGKACGAQHLRIGKHTVSDKFKVNEKVQAMFAVLWYGAKINTINEDGTYLVAWETDNYLTSTTVSIHQLRHLVKSKKKGPGSIDAKKHKDDDEDDSDDQSDVEDDVEDDDDEDEEHHDVDATEDEDVDDLDDLDNAPEDIRRFSTQAIGIDGRQQSGSISFAGYGVMMLAASVVLGSVVALTIKLRRSQNVYLSPGEDHEAPILE